MNRLHRLAALAAALACSACAAFGQPGARGAAIVAGAVAAESAVQARCPTGPIGLSIFLQGRVTFDLTLGLELTPAEAAVVKAARDNTNAVCHITATAANVPQGSPLSPSG